MTDDGPGVDFAFDPDDDPGDVVVSGDITTNEFMVREGYFDQVPDLSDGETLSISKIRIKTDQRTFIISSEIGVAGVEIREDDS